MIQRPASTPTSSSSSSSAAPQAPASLSTRTSTTSASWLETARIVSGSQVLAQVGFGLATPMLPLYLERDLGMTDRGEVALWSGLLAGTSAMAMAVVSPLWGVLADRFGRRLMLLRSLWGGAILMSAMAFAGAPAQLLVLRGLQGAFTGSVSAAAALLAATTPVNKLGAVLGGFNAAVQLGASLGPALGGLAIGAFGFRGAFLISGLMLAIGALPVHWRVAETRAPAPERGGPRTRGLLAGSLQPFRWRSLRGVLVLQVGVQGAASGVMTLLPLYARDIPHPAEIGVETVAGLALTATAAGAAVSAPVLGWLGDRYGTYRLLAGAGGTVVLALLLQALPLAFPLFLAARVLQGLAGAGVALSVGVLVKRATPEGREGAAYGALATAQALGWALGPLGSATITATAGFPALFVAAAALVAASLVPVLAMREQPRPQQPT